MLSGVSQIGFEIDRPRKGTETRFRLVYNQGQSTFEIDRPRKGTETLPLHHGAMLWLYLK